MKNFKELTEGSSSLFESSCLGGCGECQASCQSACKTTCVVPNQECIREDRIEENCVI